MPDGIPLLADMIKKTLRCLFFLLLVATAAWAEAPRVDVPIGDSPTLGPADAPVTIFEFIDFQ